jgi:hypothetical protein
VTKLTIQYYLKNSTVLINDHKLKFVGIDFFNDEQKLNVKVKNFILLRYYLIIYRRQSL